jgi:hypothetical protein
MVDLSNDSVNKEILGSEQNPYAWMIFGWQRDVRRLISLKNESLKRQNNDMI